MTAKRTEDSGKQRPSRPIRTAVLRGLAVVAPPLLTIVIFFWIAGTIHQYVLEPVRLLARNTVVWAIADVRTYQELPKPEKANREREIAESDPKVRATFDYQEITDGARRKYIPRSVYDEVRDGTDSMPKSAKEIYRRYVELKYLRPYQMIPYFLCGFILVLYLLGKFMAAGAGRFFGGTFERGINRVPIVRKVYSSAKQVSDFFLTDRETVQYSRVVAVEWPRKGIWCLSLVTGASLKEVEAAAGEEVLSVLIPNSPLPVTGFTVSVRKSETIELDITIDEAIQFIVSCGVVVPPSQMERLQAPAQGPAELAVAGDSPESAGENP
ncbi:MAG: DUF502 domain-containing protein [Planctomycetes bacterium]|nr:DUF502 domain-containing protein [Planctomycetota bacterium]